MELPAVGSLIYSFFSVFLIPALFSVGFVVFVWGVFQYFIQGGHDELAQTKGKVLMVWALGTFVVWFIIWALVDRFF